MKQCKKRVNYHLNQDQIDWLEAHKAKTGASIAEIIRRAIDAYKQKVQ